MLLKIFGNATCASASGSVPGMDFGAVLTRNADGGNYGRSDGEAGRGFPHPEFNFSYA